VHEASAKARVDRGDVEVQVWPHSPERYSEVAEKRQLARPAPPGARPAPAGDVGRSMIRFAAPVCWPPELESTTVVPAAQQGSTSTPVVALVLFGIFVLLAAVGRALIQYRRTGDTGFRRDAAGASSVSGVGGLVVAVAAPIADLVGLLDPIPGLTHPVLASLGFSLAILGIFGVFAAQLAMGNSWRVGVDPSERVPLVTAGPFRLVRNPIYTAEAVAFGGFALMVPNPAAVAGFALVIAGIEYQVRRIEEPHLHAVHATAYQDYAASVGRFLPGIGMLRSPRSRPARRR
jgi:protein-S-isoprenylcysteine O-methyltransferase Ste14